MTTTLIQPGRRAARLTLTPTTSPIGYTARGPIFLAAGGRGGGVEMIVDDRDDDSDPFDSADDDDDDDDDRDEDLDDEDDDPRARRQPDPRRPRGKRGKADDPEDWTPPTRERWESTLERLHRANGEAARRRHLAKVLDKIGASDADALRERLLDWGIDPDSGQRITGDGDQDDRSDLFDTGDPDDHDGRQDKPPTRTREQVIADRRRFESRGAEREAARYKPAVALFAAESALREAGWSGQNMARALKLIDPELVDIEFDETSGWPFVTGLDEQIEGLRDEFPEWFRTGGGNGNGRQGGRRRDDDGEDESFDEPRPRPRRRTGVREIDGGDRGRPAAQPKSWVQMLNDRIVRGR